MRGKKKNRKAMKQVSKFIKYKKYIEKYREKSFKKMSRQELESEYLASYQATAKISTALKAGDPFSFARGKEIYMACKFGHKIADTYSGEDASSYYSLEQYEYKSTTQMTIQGAYTGISVHPTWPEQLSYLSTEKIGCYNWHYYGRFNKDTGMLEEAWRMKGSIVNELIIEKLKTKYGKNDSKKDPRLSAVMTEKEIYKYGEKVEI